MPPSFQTYRDHSGNLWIADGWIAQLRSGIRLPAGSGDILPPLPALIHNDRYTPVPAATTGTFVGGSGRNILTSGLTPSVSGPPLPIGIWQPARPGIYTLGIFTLTVTGSSAATIHDGTNTVAILSTGGTAPIGNYASTTYGAATYNGSSAFTLAAAAEQGAPGSFPTYSIVLSAGTAQAGTYTADDSANYVSATDTDWTIVIASDGSAQLLDGATVIAERPAGGHPYDPSGAYDATAAGMTAHNSGDPWTAYISSIPAAPRAGYVYLTVTETADILSGITGPHFATALPPDTATLYHIPLAQSDGLGNLIQFHTGLLLWTSAGSSAPAAATPPAAPQLIAWDNNGYGYPYLNGFDGSGNPLANFSAMMYQIGDTQWDYQSAMILHASELPLTTLVVNSRDLDPLTWFADSIADLNYVQLLDCTGFFNTLAALAGCTKIAHLEISGGLGTPPVITGMPLLESLILANNTELQSPPTFTGANCPLLTYLDLSGCTDAALTDVKMDAMYSQLDALTIDAGAKTLIGNGRYTSASATARTSLTSKGWTITL